MKLKRICIIHLNQIGDLVFSLPLLKALKDNYPDSEIHSIIRPQLKELLVNSPYTDKLIVRNIGVKKNISLLKQIRKNRYDLLIALSNSEECLLLASLSGAKIKAGFARPPWDFGLNIKERIEGHHSWYNNFKLLKRLKIEIKKKDYVGLLKLPPENKIKTVVDSLTRYVVISPGTSAQRTIKAWENDKFADLTIALKEKYGLNPVFVGSKENVATSDEIIKIIGKKYGDMPVNPVRSKSPKATAVPEDIRGRTSNGVNLLNLTGKIGLVRLCYLLKSASLFVGVDSGVMHLASAFDIPVVGIFGPTDPFYVGPLNKKSAVVQRKEIKCVPCYLKGCEERMCMKKIEVADVINACDLLLNQNA